MPRTLQAPTRATVGSSRAVRRSRALVAASAAAVLLLPSAAVAARSSIGGHEVTSAHGANVHAAIGRRPNGPYIGHLFPGDRFRVRAVRGAWCGGRAGGHVDQAGGVLCRDLSDR